jgi:hypothetical protein
MLLTILIIKIYLNPKNYKKGNHRCKACQGSSENCSQCEAGYYIF